MSGNNLLPDALQRAAHQLERRLQILRVPSRKILLAEWDVVPQNLRNHIPDWYINLLESYSLYYVVLQCSGGKWQFNFASPSNFADEFAKSIDGAEDNLYGGLTDFGFLPFAYGENGDVWLFRINSASCHEVFYLGLTDWSGNQPVFGDGLLPAGGELATVFAIMAVEGTVCLEQSGHEVPTSVLWREEKHLSSSAIVSFEHELNESAAVLEQRYETLGIITHKIRSLEWDVLPEEIRRWVPEWIPKLLENHSLAGGIIEDNGNGTVWPFVLFEPKNYLEELGNKDNPVIELPKFGFVPIAHDTKGNVWITKIDGGASSPIYLLDSSGAFTYGKWPWKGGEPDKRNGLVFASSRLALLFASMAVSDLSFAKSAA